MQTWCERKLGWEREYAVSKAVQFGGRWCVMHVLPASPRLPAFPLQVKKIVRSCKRGGSQCYEVEWMLSTDACALVSAARGQLKSLDEGTSSVSSPLVTIEPQNLVALSVPAAVSSFEELKLQKKAKSRKKKTEAPPKPGTAVARKKESGTQLKLTTSSSNTLALGKSPRLVNAERKTASLYKKCGKDSVSVMEVDGKENVSSVVGSILPFVDGPSLVRVDVCDTRHDARDPRHDARDPRHDARDPRHDVRDTCHDVRDTCHDVRDTCHDVRDPCPDVRDPRPDVRDPRPDVRDPRPDVRGEKMPSHVSSSGWRSSGDSNNASKFYLTPGRLYPSSSSCDFDLSVFEESDEDNDKDISLVVDRFIKLNVEERKNLYRTDKSNCYEKLSEKPSSSSSLSPETLSESSAGEGCRKSNVAGSKKISEAQNSKEEHRLCEGTSFNLSPGVQALHTCLTNPERRMCITSQPSSSEDLKTKLQFCSEPSLIKLANFRSNEHKVQPEPLSSDLDCPDDGYGIRGSLYDRANFHLKHQVKRVQCGAGRVKDCIPPLESDQICLVSTSGDEQPEKRVFEQRCSSDLHSPSELKEEGKVSISFVTDGGDELGKSVCSNVREYVNVVGTERLSTDKNDDVRRRCTGSCDSRPGSNSMVLDKNILERVTQNDMLSNSSLVLPDTNRRISDFGSSDPELKFYSSVDLFEDSFINSSHTVDIDLILENSFKKLALPGVTKEKDVTAKNEVKDQAEKSSSMNGSFTIESEFVAFNERHYEQYEAKPQSNLPNQHSTPKLSVCLDSNQSLNNSTRTQGKLISFPKTRAPMPSVCFDLVNSRWLDSDSFLSSPGVSNPTRKLSEGSHDTERCVQNTNSCSNFNENSCGFSNFQKFLPEDKSSVVCPQDPSHDFITTVSKSCLGNEFSNNSCSSHSEMPRSPVARESSEFYEDDKNDVQDTSDCNTSNYVSVMHQKSLGENTWSDVNEHDCALEKASLMQITNDINANPASVVPFEREMPDLKGPSLCDQSDNHRCTSYGNAPLSPQTSANETIVLDESIGNSCSPSASAIHSREVHVVQTPKGEGLMIYRACASEPSSLQKKAESPSHGAVARSPSPQQSAQDSFSMSPLLVKASLADRLKLKYGEKLVDCISRRRRH